MPLLLLWRQLLSDGHEVVIRIIELRTRRLDFDVMELLHLLLLVKHHHDVLLEALVQTAYYCAKSQRTTAFPRLQGDAPHLFIEIQEVVSIDIYMGHMLRQTHMRPYPGVLLR